MSRPGWFPDTVVVATHNPGKLAEWRTLLGPLGVTVKTPHETLLPEPEETEPTYRGNAELKARAAAGHTGLAALADDTGFEVDALADAPGVRTARWAADHGGYPAALRALWDDAGGPSTARLVCAVALVIGDEVRVEHAELEGTLRWPPVDAPGFAALLDTRAPLVTEGVLAHRRAAFERLTSR